MIVLGLNFETHYPSAALVEDGQLVCMVEQERYSRKKRASGQPPRPAVEYCLKEARIIPEHINAISIGWDVELFHGLPDPPPSHLALRGIRGALPRSFHGLGIPVYRVRHHLAHAACAFYSSDYPVATILVADGQREMESTMLAVGNRAGIHLLLTLPISRSLGYFYLTASRHAGFRGEGEGKFMGLASYGLPNQSMPMYLAEDGLHYVDELEVSAQYHPTHSVRTELGQWWTANCYPYPC